MDPKNPPDAPRLAEHPLDRVDQIAALLSDAAADPNLWDGVRQAVDWDALHREIHRGPSPRCPICEWMRPHPQSPEG